MTKRVLIINEGYSSNLGDQAIKESMEKLFQSLGYETGFCYFTNPSLLQLPLYRYKPSVSSEEYLYVRIKKLLARIFSPLIYCRYFFSMRAKIKISLQRQPCDFIVIGGGQIINSSSKQKLSFFALALFLWVRAAKKNGLKVYLVGVGAVGKFHSFEKYLYKRSLENVDAVWMRDTFSQESLKKHFNKKSKLIPDVAFFEAQATPSFEKLNAALVGIFSYYELSKKTGDAPGTRDAYHAYWKKIVQGFRQKGIEVILFYTTESDAIETELFQQYLADEEIDLRIAEIESLEDLNKLYEKATYVYSARMHALILGIKKGCKAEAYVFSQKLQSFADEYISKGFQASMLSDKLVASLQDEFLISKPTSL